MNLDDAEKYMEILQMNQIKKDSLKNIHFFYKYVPLFAFNAISSKHIFKIYRTNLQDSLVNINCLFLDYYREITR